MTTTQHGPMSMGDGRRFRFLRRDFMDCMVVLCMMTRTRTFPFPCASRSVFLLLAPALQEGANRGVVTATHLILVTVPIPRYYYSTGTSLRTSGLQLWRKTQSWVSENILPENSTARRLLLQLTMRRNRLLRSPRPTPHLLVKGRKTRNPLQSPSQAPNLLMK